MASIFTKIINQEIPSYKIYEDENFYAFLDIFPLAKGHTLLVPKVEIDYLFDVEDGLLSNMLPLSKKIAKAIEKAFPCNRVGVVVLGLEVPHAHIHLVPINGEDDLNFANPKLKFTPEEFEQIAAAIKANL